MGENKRFQRQIQSRSLKSKELKICYQRQFNILKKPVQCTEFFPQGLFPTKLSVAITSFAHPKRVTCKSRPTFSFFFIIYIYLFFVLLGLHCCASFSLVVAAAAALQLRCTGFSLWRLLLWSTAVGHAGLSRCGFWALEHRLNGCGP